MSIFDNQPSGVRALIQTGREGRRDIEWSVPFEAELFIQKDRKGKCCVVAIVGMDDFAEFDPRHEQENATELSTEDYALRVLELPLGTRVR